MGKSLENEMDGAEKTFCRCTRSMSHLQRVMYLACFGYRVIEGQRPSIQHRAMRAVLFKHIWIVRRHDQRAVVTP
jgi:hypothetical protein